MIINGQEHRSVSFKDGKVLLINQNKLPHTFEITACESYQQVAAAIHDMTVRGAPAIGAAGAYGMVLAAMSASDQNFSKDMEIALAFLLASRPTAVDLKNALHQVHADIISCLPDINKAKEIALVSAERFTDASAEDCRLIGEVGQELIKDEMNILTHCNAGALATVDWGTALAVLRMAHRKGKKFFVYVDETRPRLQGARLTAFELQQEGISHAIITDSMAGHFMQQDRIDLVITGADRICLNGDFANKIGTYSLAVLAKAHNIPFYVAAPQSTFDLNCEKGNDIQIEERSVEEITHLNGKLIANPGSTAFNPAFDVTPGAFVTGFITCKGTINPSDIRVLNPSME
jgi:methylthioribose-1-phosphate isomerase